MSCDLSNKSVMVWDNGLFPELAIRLAREFGRVFYFSPWATVGPLVCNVILGDGIPDITRVEDPLHPDHGEIDLYVFPDLFRGGTQQYLEQQGKLVWGARDGDWLEIKRIAFRELQKKLGLPTPEYATVTGVSSLRSFLKDHGRCFIKCSSRFRGNMETWEFKDEVQSEYILDRLAVNLGGAKELVRFMVEEPIDTDIETGIDTYGIDGQFPKCPMQGIEIKDKFILSSAQLKSETPPEISEALEALAPVLKAERSRQFMSAEFRVTDKWYLTDICHRSPDPGLGCTMEMVKNFCQIIYHGAQGELIEPEYLWPYGVQAAVHHNHDADLWKQFEIPKNVRQWFKLMEFCENGNLAQVIPRPPHTDKIGWLMGVGNTIEEATNHLKYNLNLIKHLPVDVKIDGLQEAIEEAQEMEKAGIEFSDDKLPKPESVAK